VSGSGWDWAEIEASDYPVVTEPRLLIRDCVYCEFWSSLGGEPGAYGFISGLQMTWEHFVVLRETPAGESLTVNVYQSKEPLHLPVQAARFSLWTAPENPRWPRTTVAVWTLDGGFKTPGRA
jgi:hypothetical protein